MEREKILYSEKYILIFGDTFLFFLLTNCLFGKEPWLAESIGNISFHCCERIIGLH